MTGARSQAPWRLALPRTPAGRAALALVAIAAAFNLLVVVVDALAPSPGGEPSSSFATEPAGFAAWAELARRNGVGVSALRRDPRDADLPARGTVVALDSPRLADADARALRAFAERGGRVVAGGRRPNGWLGPLADPGAPVWERGGPRRASPASVPAGGAPAAGASPIAGVQAVETGGDGHWTRIGDRRTLLAGGRQALLIEQVAGRGSLVLLADSSPLQNRLLAKADNAALAIALAGEGPLIFAEAAHGYGDASGLAALPDAWKLALGLGLAAALMLMAARGRRFGPPESRRRELPPPRAAYVDALAATLARSRRPEDAIVPVRAAALEHLRRRAGRSAGDEGLLAAARAAGISERDAAALLRPATSEADAVAVARAHAVLARTAVPGRIPAMAVRDEGTELG